MRLGVRENNERRGMGTTFKRKGSRILPPVRALSSEKDPAGCQLTMLLSIIWALLRFFLALL